MSISFKDFIKKAVDLGYSSYDGMDFQYIEEGNSYAVFLPDEPYSQHGRYFFGPITKIKKVPTYYGNFKVTEFFIYDKINKEMVQITEDKYNIFDACFHEKVVKNNVVCSCGAKYTSFPNNHLHFCELYSKGNL